MAESSPDEHSSKRKDFICGVVEGFYGRPWTTEQRKDLFQKLKKWNMDMYVYAPKDDYKHRAYWRDLYTVEEAEHLTSLISAAKAQGITFCYALSPGLDITYSSQKEITALKRKLEQVSQFGCTCFALLFDDIELEMSEADKQIFQSFAHAQVSVTNEIQQHLGCPRFLLCPTQYCSTRAMPTVTSSEYLNTLGTKLSHQIDIMWTGPKVISKTLTAECIEEITQVLRRPPVIWDNLHANDYDQKRIFLGPYCGRSPELIPLLRGVLTNPNCEYNSNLIAIHTLAHWASCSLDAPTHMDSVSWDIKLERESEQGVCDDETLTINKNVYHHRQALRLAINEWLPEFSIPKTAQGPVIKPQTPAVLPVPIIPIMPSVNTCMTLMTCTSNTASDSHADMGGGIPTINTARLQALADVTVCASGSVTQMSAVETLTPIANPVMNSLVSPTKVVLNESIPNPIIPIANSNVSIPAELPVSTLPVPILGLKDIERENGDKSDYSMSEKTPETLQPGASTDAARPTSLEDLKKDEDGDQIIVDEEKDDVVHNGVMSIGETPPRLTPTRDVVSNNDIESEADTPSDVNMNDAISENGSMQVEPSNSPQSTDMMVESSDQTDNIEDRAGSDSLTAEDLLLLCELFYLPFEHGARGLRLLHDFHWLAAHAAGTLQRNKPENSEWRRRRCRFAWWCSRSRRLARRLALAPNRELYSELQPYLWELCCVLALLDGFVRWCELGKFTSSISMNTQGSYTWFSKGWREAFESGAQEPWVFRGGLTADLRRLLPVESSGEAVRPAAAPVGPPMGLRPYTPADEEEVRAICHKTCRDGSDCSELFPSDLQTLPADRLVAPFLTLTPEFCMLVEDDSECRELTDTVDTVDLEQDPDKLELLERNRRSRSKPQIVGYACAALNSKEFYKKQEIAWIPEMCRKYPKELADREDLTQAAKDCINYFHSWSSEARPAAESVTSQHPALVSCCVLRQSREPLAPHRLVACLLTALRANGVTGVHACINTTDHYLHQFYTKLGFVEILTDNASGRIYLGRTF